MTTPEVVLLIRLLSLLPALLAIFRLTVLIWVWPLEEKREP